MKKILMLLCFASVLVPSTGQERDLVQEINNLLKCCSLTGGNASDKKITSVGIDQKGMISFLYNNKEQFTHNFFELYKTEEAPLGFLVNDSNFTLEFHINNSTKKMIRFGDRSKVSEAEYLFTDLFKENLKHYRPALKLDLEGTIDSINRSLTSAGSERRIQLRNNGDLEIGNHNYDGYLFNLGGLKNHDRSRYFQVNGIVLFPHSYGSEKGRTTIQFTEGNNFAGSVDLMDQPNEKILALHQLFVHLYYKVKER